ncbi:MAG: restriction endonuclease subunit S [bacterium]|nr:restriction endonuclease subunit S [bacterium]
MKNKNNWTASTIGELFEVTNGKTNTDEAVLNGKYPLFDRSIEIKYSDKFLFDTEAVILPGEGKDFIPRYYIGKFDLHQRAYAIFPKSKIDLSLKFLYYWMLYKSQYLTKMAVGSTVKSLRLYMLKNFPLEFPDHKSQEKITNFFELIDKKLAKADQIIQKTETLKQGLMLELLTKGLGHKKFKKTKIGEIPDEWEVMSVGQICDCIVPGRNKPKIFNGDIPWITIPNIQDSRIQYNEATKYVSRQELKNCGNKIIPANSVIMSCVGDFGIVAVTDREIAINQQLHAFLPSSKLDQNFLKFSLILQKDFMENLATKTSVPYLNKTSCNSIPIAKPSLEEQRKIGTILFSIDHKILIEKMNKEKLQILKKGLMQDIFSQKVKIN